MSTSSGAFSLLKFWTDLEPSHRQILIMVAMIVLGTGARVGDFSVAQAYKELCGDLVEPIFRVCVVAQTR